MDRLLATSIPAALLCVALPFHGANARGDLRVPGGAGAAGGSQAAASCADGLRDQSGGGCLQASSIPGPGLLFPPPHDGGTSNVAGGSYAFVGGGVGNEAAGYGSTVVGGAHNEATGVHATIVGGYLNEAGGDGAAIGGGGYNEASGDDATIAGGFVNYAAGSCSAVGGGYINAATGAHATVPGGRGNFATGATSFGAGRQTRATHPGSFVWGDSQTGTKPSSQADELSIYASGGTRIFSNATATTGVLLLPGAGLWTIVSDRAIKEDLAPVDGREMLALVAGLPLWAWSYRSQELPIRHLGPTAQDFHAAFGLGLGETTIDTLDPAGVALAAIQGLRAELAELRGENRELRAQLEEILMAAESRGGGR